ncbi:ATP-binding protein [Flavobacterium sp.]|uniref:ATP-binding protein n=1 Tax=Flavobacterium sp. TaxID=239 RepID=UPI0025BAB3F7|nr:ATP-binding protein [Flavobacterium sp.]MBA4155422.1 hybrid sensor histidine kinase/response regulator [Flavobacterium sp.]
MTYKIALSQAVYYYLAILIIIALGIIFYFNSKKVISSGNHVTHTYAVMDKNQELLLDVMSFETASRGYLLTGNPSFISSYRQSLAQVEQNIVILLHLTKDNPSQHKRVEDLAILIANRIKMSEKLIEAKSKEPENSKEQYLFLQFSTAKTEAIRESVKAINAEEFMLLKVRKSENTFSTDMNKIVLFSLFAGVFLLLLFIYFVFRNHTIINEESKAHSYAMQLASKYSLSLIEASRDPLFTISPEGIITDANQASVQVTEMAREKLIGSNFTTYFTDSEKAKEGYEAVFSKGFVSDYPLTIKDGVLTQVLFNGSVYKDDNNTVIGAVVVARDITEQKRIEDELIKAKQIAEEAAIKAEKATNVAVEAVKSKQQFLSNMSHEIRTPMNAIIGFTKVVLKTELTAKQKEYLMAIKMSGDAMIVLINDILDLAKVDAGRMNFEKTPFKLNLSIAAMLHLFETKIQEKNLALLTEYDERIPEVLVGDPVRLHQIILNLISNAVKFTNKGSIVLAVRLLKEEDKKASIKFSVTDTGIGIKKSKISSIFDNFQQATSSTARLFGGTGLGLAIVKQLVEAQGGTITVESTLDVGSTFSFVLDFSKTSALAVVEPEMIPLNTDIKDTKILVVEDMELNQLLMKTLLDDFGFECEIAANGKLAVEKLETTAYDIILMDLQMPEMNGFEATTYIRETLKLTVPIIALTADVTTVDVARCKEVGMNDYISKPVDERLLYSKLIGLIKKPILIIDHEVGKPTATDTIRYVDMSYLNKLTQSNTKLIREMITAYLLQTPPLVTMMRKSYNSKDWALLKSTVHKMIPSFSIVGISDEYTKMAKQVQVYADALEHAPDLEEMIKSLERVCNHSCVELQNELNAMNDEK